MSAFVDETGKFAPFYGTCILSEIKNAGDISVLLHILKREKGLKVVNNLHYKFYDIFSQTLSFITNGSEKCSLVDKYYKENGGSFKKNNFLEFYVLLEQHYISKEILEKFPQDFKLKLNLRFKIVSNKLVLKFDISEKHEKILQSITTDLNKNYDINKTFNKHIVLAYLKPTTNPNNIFKLTEEKKEYLKQFLPKKITINHPNIYQYDTLDSFYVFTHWMY